MLHNIPTLEVCQKEVTNTHSPPTGVLIRESIKPQGLHYKFDYKNLDNECHWIHKFSLYNVGLAMINEDFVIVFTGLAKKVVKYQPGEQ